jgi:predicted kinase
LKGGVEERSEARGYLVQCQRHLLDARVQLVVVGGLPGTGKSTLAAALGDELGWPVLRSDEVRKELAGLDSLEHAPAAYGRGLYMPSITDATYETILSRAHQLLAWGESVIVDASFARARWRDEAARLAADADAEHTELHCLLPAPVAAARLARRAAEGRDASDATASIAGEMAHEFDPWPGATAVGTLPPVEDVVPTVLDRLDAVVLRRATRAGA